MSSKPQIFGNESDDNLFSKVLSGMKSVFNNSSKSKIKKLSTSDNVTTEIQQIDLPNKSNILETISVETEIVDNNANKNDIPQTSLNNMAVIENVLGINEFLPISQLHEDNAVSAENLIPKFSVHSLDISHQETDQNSYENQNVASVAQEDAFKHVSDNNSTDEIIMSFEDFSNAEQEPILISLEEKSNIEHEGQQIDKCPKKSLDTQKTKNVSKRKLKSKNKTDEIPDTEDLSLINDVLPKDELKDNTEALQNKPRIVLKFRSEKSGPRSTNMKIISNNEKSDDDSAAVINRRSLRGRLPIISEDNPIDDIKIQIDVQQIDTKPAINANNDSNDLMKTPPSRKNKRNNNINTDSNSEDSPPLEKNAIKRSARRRSKEFSENVLANAIARKEKIYNETSPSQTRLSRRIKPTAKILANRELRLGLETQNNARLGLILEKNQDDCKMTRSSSRKVSEKMKTEVTLLKNQHEKPKMKRQLKPSSDKKSQIKMECENNEDGHARIEIVHSGFADVGNKTSDKKVKKTKRPITVNSDNPEENEYRRLNRLKKKHLKKLGLKAVSDNKNHTFRDSDIVSDESTMDSTNTEAIIEHLNTRDQNLYLSNEGFSNEIDESCKTEDSNNIDNQLDMLDMKIQKNGKQTKRKIDHFDSEDSISSEKNDTTKRNTYEESTFRITRKRFKMKGSTDNIDPESLANQETNSNRIKKKPNNHNHIDSINLMSCLCNKQSNIFAESNSVSDPEFCRAIENIGGRYVGCGRVINSTQLVRAGSRAPFFLSCDLHRSRLSMHHCCAGCGVFCTQGVHYQCSEGHLFHWECSLPFVPLLIAFGSDGISSLVDQPAPPKGTITDLYNAEPGCPHCGLDQDTLEPVNLECFKVNLEMSCSNPVIFLPNPRLQWVPARMSFSSNPKPIDDVIDDDTSMSILPQETLDALKNYFLSNISTNENMFDEFGKESEPDFDLIEAVCDSENTTKRILSALKSGANICRRISSMSDGTFLHLAVKELNLCALHIFRMLGLELDAFDKEQRTPLILAAMSYDDEVQSKNYSDVKNESDTENNLDESKNDIIGNTIVYRQIVDYLIKGGSDPTLKGPHGASVLHFAAKYGDIATCTSLLNLNMCKVRSFVNQQDDAGLTPLIWAVESKHIAVARLLLEHGGNAVSRDFENNTPLHWAASSGCKTILEDLLNHGSEVNVINVNGDTPLHFCARYDHYCCLIILLARGAAINDKNLDGEMAIDCVDDDTSECYSTLAINEQLQSIINPPIRDEKIISNDVSNGKESNPIKCVNSVDDEDLTGKFTYITKNCYTVDVNIDRKITSMQVCDCKDGCGQTNALCTCTNVSMQSWYDVSGKLVQYFDYDDPPMIFECNDICSCNKSQCVNRGIEKGSFASLKVFRQTESTARGGGWGVCTIQPILKGSFVCEYVGEILPGSLAYHRTDDSYLFELETKGDILEENVEPYCIDAKNYGNVSRFINHKCEPNIVPVRVFVNHRDLRFPRIAFFACRDISSGEELGFDYGEKFWTIKSKSFGCNCGSAKCRYSHVDEDEDD